MFFASAGAEAVDAAMKFARAATGRPRFVSCQSSFHGVTLGPLSLVGDEFFKEGFGPLLPGCELVPFGDLDRLEAQLRRGDVAAFVVEPIQGRTVALPPPGYLRAAQDLCRRYGTMLVLDEIQTGLGRTGRWFALDEWGLQPDFVLVGKALSGGYMPVAAMVTTREIHRRAVGTLERSYVHQSTYGRNRLSMAAGLAAIRVIERDGLVEHAAHVGKVLRDGLAELQQRHEIVKEIRGSGLMIGIELGAPRGSVARLSWRLVRAAAEGLYPQLIVIPLHRDHGVITMAAGKNDVVKLLPPLTLSEAEAQQFLDAFAVVLADCEGSTGKNWGVVRDIAKATLRRRGNEEAPGSDTVPLRRVAAPRNGDGERLLITGATGFIGGRLARRLAQEGRPVRCLVREHSDTSSLEELDVELAVGDLTSGGSLARAVNGCGFVFHCGALVSDWATTQEITRTNVAGTRNLLEAAAGTSVRRFVHFSTTDVYGHPGTGAVDESYASRGFSNWYAQTKLAAEGEVRRVEAGGGPRCRDPAPGDHLRTGIVRRGGRDRARDPRPQHAADRRGSLRRRPVLRREPARRRPAGPRARRGAGAGVQRQRRPGGDLEGVHRRPRGGPRLLEGEVERALLGRQRRRHLARARVPAAAADDGPDGETAAVPPGRPGARQGPDLQQPQSPRAARLGAPGGLPHRPRRHPRLAADRLPGLTRRAGRAVRRTPLPAAVAALSRRPPATGPGCSRSRGT